MRFLIVEDHPLFREALEGALQMAAPAAEILQATSIDGALEQAAAAAELDLILLDLSMPGTTGLSGIIRIRKAFPRIPVVIVSGHQDPQIVAGALSLGVSGYILKSSSKQELAHSIGEVLRGAVCVPAAYRALVRPQRAAGPAQDLLKRLHELTPQQLRVLEMLKRGLQNKQIAFELNISETTVKVHVSDILRKLNVLSRTKAIVEMSRIDFATLAGEGAGLKGERSQADPPSG
ncbi:response regulator transcription factor [Bradyrhizobium sp. NBAIM20]|uniref:response regulator n=1 Tax=unclassified Bradyrhizobium TaxID=2631580 RepID=UPI001CD77373|nr:MULTISPECIES: response regulator transcription factor [unclassified Bradyrhizobium]MCA1416047.1 response regulator transcription factor [Bradyrhizobium sp. NBAIM20]MCA1465477.1 response regulator transcription factor [Bradyrhizobium sp. NBAIM18]